VSLAWSTVALLVLLLPGFLFFVGLYLPERISRDVVPGGTLTQLGGIVLVAFFINALVFSVHTTACDVFSCLPCIRFDYALGAFNANLKDAVPSEALARNITENRWWILGYFLGTSTLGLYVGLKTGKLIIKGPLRFLAKHSWIYDLIDPDDNTFTFAYVLTNLRTDDRILIYRGYLKEYCFTPEGTISYLVLRGCSRYYLRLGSEKPTTSPPDDWVVLGQSSDGQSSEAPEKQWSVMVIEGEDIANVVFDRYCLTLTDKGLAELNSTENSLP